MTPLLLIGGGGHCRSCIDVIESTGVFEVAGIVERAHGETEPVMGYEVIGHDDDLRELLRRHAKALITIGHIKSPELRMRLFELVRSLGGTLEIVVSPNSYVSKHAHLGNGSVVMHGATVNAGARIGANCIINSHALVEHDAVVGPHSHIATGARINGDVHVGAGTFVGSGATVNHGLDIGAGCVIASGSIIRNDVPSGTRVLGEWR